jgi:hypothetical protein
MTSHVTYNEQKTQSRRVLEAELSYRINWLHALSHKRPLTDNEERRLTDLEEQLDALQ